MKHIWWLAGGFLFLVVLYFTALPGDFPVARSGNGLVGTYTVNGIDPTGLEYSGTLVIAEPDTFGVYPMEWIITGSIVSGEGILDNDELTVQWRTTSAAGEGRGTARYLVAADGTITGTRTVEGFSDPGTEEIFPDA